MSFNSRYSAAKSGAQCRFMKRYSPSVTMTQEAATLKSLTKWHINYQQQRDSRMKLLEINRAQTLRMKVYSICSSYISLVSVILMVQHCVKDIEQ